MRDGSYDFLGNIEAIIKNAVLLDTKTDAKRKTTSSAFIHSFYSVLQNSDGTGSVFKLFVDEMFMKKAGGGTLRRAYQLKKYRRLGFAA